jgi:hypothetical protein
MSCFTTAIAKKLLRISGLKKAKPYLNCRIDRSGSGKTLSRMRAFFSYALRRKGKEDWYLASGGMCQRNSVEWRDLGPLRKTIEFVARQ